MDRLKYWCGGGRAAFAALIVGGMLCACSPDFNWREVHADGDGYRVMLPDKPVRVQRRINLDGLEVDMVMQAVDVNGITFAVGSIRLPAPVPVNPSSEAAASSMDGQRERALAAMRAQLVRNVGGTEEQAKKVEVTVAARSGESAERVSGWQVEASGQPKTASGDVAKPVRMLARFVGRGDRVWQAVVIGPPTLDRDQAATFIDSLRLID